MSDEDTAQVETQAREMGWRPKEEFKGDESKWVDASTFVERGEHVLPIVKATNERLRSDLTRTNSELADVRQALQASQETIAALEKYHQEDVKQKVDRAREKLKAELVAAKKSGDVEGEVELTEELTKLNNAEEAAATRDNGTQGTQQRQQQQIQKDYTKEPDFVSWKNDNAWYGDDVLRTSVANGVAQKLRANGDKTIGRAFLDKVTEGTNAEFARFGTGSRQSKVEGSRGGTGGNSGGVNGKSYADLPAEAKAACASYERDLVGKGRKYETVEAWRKSYAEQYFTEV